MGETPEGSPKGTQLPQAKPELCLDVPNALVCSVGDAWEAGGTPLPHSDRGHYGLCR